jgi:hypothetical protein
MRSLTNAFLFPELTFLIVGVLKNILVLSVFYLSIMIYDKVIKHFLNQYLRANSNL